MSEKSYMLEKLMQLADMSKHINMSMDLRHIVNYAVEHLPKIMGLSITSIFLLDKERNVLYMAASNDRSIDKEKMSRIKFQLGEGLIGKVGASLEPVIVDDVEKDRAFRGHSNPKYGDKSCRILPMIAAGKLVGVITMTSVPNNPEEAYHDTALLSLFVNHTAIAVRNAQLLATARDEADRDGLTKLYTHRYFHVHLEREIARARRYHTKLSLMMIDIDNFKEFNDSFGHLIGDEVLVGVSAIMLANMRVGVDIPCRYGGDEFVAILPETDVQAAFDAAERIRMMVELLEFSAGEKRLATTLSIGVCEYARHLSKVEFIDLTDKAMFASKEAGRNRTTVAQVPPVQEPSDPSGQ